MMMDWNAYRDQVNGAVREMSTANPDIVRAYAGLSAANAKSKHIDAKTRELIALAVAVTLRCDGCINAHTDAAIKAGASKEEMTMPSASPSWSMPVRQWFIRHAPSMPSIPKRQRKSDETRAS
jgi:AhpD family alkylhydroperoxidase